MLQGRAETHPDTKGSSSCKFNPLTTTNSEDYEHQVEGGRGGSHTRHFKNREHGDQRDSTQNNLV